MSRWVLPALAVAVAAAVGCGVSDVTEGIFASSGDPGGSGGSTTTTTTTTTTGTVNPTTTSGGGQGQGGAGGQGTGGSGTGGAGGSGGSPVTSITLACGDGPDCVVPPSSACCWFNFQDQAECIMGPPDPTTCNTAAQQGGYRTRIECQLPSHCPDSEVCCGTFVQVGGGSYYSQVTCQAQCDSVTLCDPANPQCPANAPNCLQSGSLPQGYFVCRN